MDVKNELAKKAENTGKVKLTKSMSIADMIKTLEPEIARALPSVITPERFTRMALNALNNTPKLAECTQMSFLAALMNAAQLGLEPNTPLGQAYLIPYKNKGVLECQFQIGYKGMLDLVYRNEMVQTVQAQVVYQNDEFYALFKLENGGYGFEVMSKTDMDAFALQYSKGISSEYSPWKTNYIDMAKKTVIKKVLKYAPLKTEFQRALSNDETIKTHFAVDMSEVEPETVIDMEEGELLESAS